jgi:hypothetical protein
LIFKIQKWNWRTQFFFPFELLAQLAFWGSYKVLDWPKAKKKGIYGYSHEDNFLKVLLLVFLKVVCEGYEKFSIMEK